MTLAEDAHREAEKANRALAEKAERWAVQLFNFTLRPAVLSAAARGEFTVTCKAIECSNIDSQRQRELDAVETLLTREKIRHLVTIKEIGFGYNMAVTMNW